MKVIGLCGLRVAKEMSTGRLKSTCDENPEDEYSMKRMPSFFSVVCCCFICLLSADALQQKKQTSPRTRPNQASPKISEPAKVAKPKLVRILVRRLNTGRLALDGVLFVIELDKVVPKKPGIAQNIRLVSAGPLKVEQEETGQIEVPTMDVKHEPVQWKKDPTPYDFLISWNLDWQERTKHQFSDRLTIDVKETWKVEKVSDTSVTQAWTTSYVLTGEETGASDTSSLLAAEQTETLIAPARGRILREIRGFIAQDGNKSATGESGRDVGDKLEDGAPAGQAGSKNSKAASNQVDLTAEIERLSSNDPVRRGLAATRLRGLGVKAAPAIPYLIGMLNDTREIQVLNETALSTVTSSPRGAALLALKAIGQPATLALIAALKANESAVRSNAAWALGEIRSGTAVPNLIALLDDPIESIPEEAVEALGKIQDGRALDPLSRLLKRGSYRQKSDAADALGRIKEPRSVDVLVEALREIPVPAARALGSIRDPRAVEPLLAMLRNKDRKSVVGPNPYAYGSVTPLETYYANAIEAVANALAEINDPRAVDPLIALLKETGRIYASNSLAACAARALGKLKDTRAVEPLVKALRGMELDYDRGPVAEALREITGERFPADPSQWEEWWKNKRTK
jgi:HEAT repeat protein